MAVTAKVFNAAITSLANEEVDWASDEIKVALFTSSLTPVQASNQYFDASPYTSNQVASGAGYTTGGAVLGSKTEAFTGQVKKFDAADTVWTTSTITARHAIVYDNTPSSNKPLLMAVDFGQDISSSGGSFTIAWDANGLFTVTVA